MADTSKLLEALSSYTGDQTSLESFVTVAKSELGDAWGNAIYEVLPNLPAHLKEKLDHAFNYYGASLSWTEIQSYLTSEEPLDVAEITPRIDTLRYWLKFFGPAGETAINELQEKLAQEAEKAKEAPQPITEMQDTNPPQTGADDPTDNATDRGYAEGDYADGTDAGYVEGDYADESYADTTDAGYAEGDYAEGDYADGTNASYAEGDYAEGTDASYVEGAEGDYTDESYADAGYTDESYADGTDESYADTGYTNGEYDAPYEEPYEEPYQAEGYQGNDYQTDEDFNNETDYVDYQSDETLGYDGRYADQPFDTASNDQDSYVDDGYNGSDGGTNGYFDEQFYGSDGGEDGYFDQANYAQGGYSDSYFEQDNFEQDDDFWQEPVYQKQPNETIEEFMAKKTFHQVDFLNAVRCWINARCIALGNKEIYTYRHYGFLIDLMEETKKDVQEVLSDPKYYPAIEKVRADGLKKLQRFISSLESDLKTAYDNLPSELTDLISDDTNASDLKAMLGAVDTSNTPELLGAAPDGFEMLEDPFAGTSIEKEMKKKSKPTTPAGNTPVQQKKSGLSFNKKPVA